MEAFLDLSPEDILRLFDAWEEGPNRARSITKGIFRQHFDHFSAIPNLRGDLQKRLQNSYHLTPLSVAQEHVSQDGTTKIAFRLDSGETIETVFIPGVAQRARNRALCISSQAGCAVGCVFCHTGLQGLRRNLRTWEILEQVRYFSRVWKAPPSHVVFMGMGEPLHNTANVFKAIETLISPNGYGLAARRITVSTAGFLSAVEELAVRFDTQIAFSLHAPNDQLRNELVPHRSAASVLAIADFMRSTERKNQPRFIIEYVLLAGVNDGIEHAEELATLLSGIRCQINLIPYNAVPGLSFRTPTREEALAFGSVLRKSGLSCTLRRSRGDDILAACGQLSSQLPRPTQLGSLS